VTGLTKAGVDSRSILARIAALWTAIAQWCAPWRRQHDGKNTSSLPSTSGDKGTSPKTSIRTMEKPRRIWSNASKEKSRPEGKSG